MSIPKLNITVFSCFGIPHPRRVNGKSAVFELNMNARQVKTISGCCKKDFHCGNRLTESLKKVNR